MNLRSWSLAVVGGIVFGGAAVVSGGDVAVTVRLLVLGLALGMLVVYDVRERRIPNRVVLPATACCLLLDAAGSIDWWALAASLAIVMVLLAVALARPRALGMGDVKLAVLIAVGLPGPAPAGLVLGLLIAAIFGCALAAARHRPLNEIALPLAPFLTLGALAALA
jgi:leader peptidase (prepilin peptidase)/N-methyltransferase